MEDIGTFLPQVQDSMSDFARFGQLINLVAFSPFKTGANALDNVNSISEGVCVYSSVLFKLHIPYINALVCTCSYTYV